MHETNWNRYGNGRNGFKYFHNNAISAKDHICRAQRTVSNTTKQKEETTMHRFGGQLYIVQKRGSHQFAWGNNHHDLKWARNETFSFRFSFVPARKSFWDTIKQAIVYFWYRPFSCASVFMRLLWHLSRYSFMFGHTRKMPEIPTKISTIAVRYI